MKITDFLKTDREKEDLRAALETLRDFKWCESPREWLDTPFIAWSKLEQLEEFLEHLVEGKELSEDTKKYMADGYAWCAKDSANVQDQPAAGLEQPKQSS